MAILSRVHMVTEGDGCHHCLNAGRAVFDQQVVIGSGALGRSQAGTPPSDAASGLVANTSDNMAARADLAEDEVKPGAPAWICELWFAAPGEPGGIYVRVTD